MIAALKRPFLDGLKWPQLFERACRDHAVVYDGIKSLLSIDKQIMTKSPVAVRILCLAYAGHCDLPVKRGS
jgi:hypothetical protein